ncbi:MAG: hypothetical protein ACE5GE_06400, partial [Phycisphaerae bacterium]
MPDRFGLETGRGLEAMQNNQFEAQLRELTDRIEALPEDQRGPLLALLDETRRRQQLIRQATDQARHALDYSLYSIPLYLFVLSYDLC